MNGETTKVMTGAEARKRVRAGVNHIYDAIKLTLGPEGKNALLPRSFNRGPRLTNDGVTVSENIKPDNEHERLAADFFKEGSKKTNELAGDGTTTTAVIAGALVNDIFDSLPDEEVPAASYGGGQRTGGVRAMRQEMKEAKEKVLELTKKAAVKVQDLDELKRISVISIGKEDQKTADTVAEMVWEVARDEEGNFIDNHIDVVEGYKGEIETEITKGMRFPAKVAHRAFVNKPERFEMEGDDVKVLITNYKLDNPHELVAVLNKLQVPKIAIFAPGFSGPTIQAIINSIQNGVFIYPVLVPALRTEQLEDLATYTGATVIDKEKGKKFHQTTEADLGFAEKISVKDTEAREDAVLMGGKGVKATIDSRIETLREQLSEAKNELSKAQLAKRIANLQAAVGVVRVGAATNAELLYLKLKVEDGVFACKAALQEGYVKGGGLHLQDVAEELGKDNILYKALKAPAEQIQRNAGGFIEVSDDVIDPAKVVRLAVEHAVGIASSLITTGIVIAEPRDRTPYEGDVVIAKAINKGTYYNAKHQGMIKEAEDEAEADRQKEFDRVLFEDHD